MDRLRRFWGQRVLPVVFDDSLSYYEMICKLTKAINDIIENNNLLEQFVGSYMPTFNDEWDVTKEYNPLSVVMYDDKLYIAKQAVPVGMSIEAGDYWEEINLPYFDAIANLNSLDVLTPDQFSGTDTEKIKAALDSINDGGTLCINRKYTLDDDLVISHLSSRQEKFIHVLGIGKNAEIALNGHNIVGDRAAGEAYGSNSVGGIFWQDINFTGENYQNGFITDRLIRMFFTGCHFYGMNNTFYGNDNYVFNETSRGAYAQSYYFNQCYFGCMKNAAFNVRKIFDCHFNNCIFEYDFSGIIVRHALEGLFITNCLMESMPNNIAIKITTTTASDGCYNLVINNCYFEDNLVSIDISSVGYTGISAIENCMCSLNRTGQTFIHMPRNLQDTYGENNMFHPVLKINGNSVVQGGTYTTANALLFDLRHEDGSTWQYQLTGLEFENNNFDLTYSNATMAELYTLNYKPKKRAHTKRGTLGFVARFNSNGTQTNTAPANIPTDVTTTMFKITSLKNTANGQDICVDNGVTETPDTWYRVTPQGDGAGFSVIIKRDDQGEPLKPSALYEERAGDKTVSVIVEWAYANINSI